MQANAYQAVTSHPQSRSLKIEATGDYFYRKITPKIRLSGQWLERAGFKPGHRVEVRLDQPGTITLLFLDQASPVAGNGDFPQTNAD
jgi:type I toxin-antitoxin system toxin SymE